MSGVLESLQLELLELVYGVSKLFLGGSSLRAFINPLNRETRKYSRYMKLHFLCHNKRWVSITKAFLHGSISIHPSVRPSVLYF
jgi:hypothetical protein